MARSFTAVSKEQHHGMAPSNPEWGHRQGLILKFHRKGKQSWQETRVRQDGDGIWRGLDYCCRKVEMMCIPVNDNLEVTAKAIEVLTAMAIGFEAWHVTHKESRSISIR